jgi:membrane protein
MTDKDRGRKAQRPGKIPLSGWKDIFFRLKDKLAEDNLTIVAAGVAFYALLAIFPAIGALVAAYAIVSDPAQVQQQVATLSGILPPQGMELLQSQLERLSEDTGGALSLGVLGGILFSLGSSTKGMKAFITGLNIAYGEEERRGFIARNAIALLLTVGAIIFVVISLGFIVVFPAFLNFFGLSSIAEKLTSILRWPLLGLFVIIGLGLLYRYAPHRSQAQFTWVSWGAVMATILWMAISMLFSLYVSHSDTYNQTYGSIGAIIILLMWFFISALAVLLGAELNAEMEHQTKKDTTTGPPQPLGKRGAQVADTVGRKHSSKQPSG